MTGEIRRQGPLGPIRGDLEIPGDKSISHRALILGALADGETAVDNLAPGADVRSTRDCLHQLGVNFSEGERGTLIVSGRNMRFDPPDSDLDAGNSGTTIRLLSGVLAGQPFRSRLVGDRFLSKRPMRRIIEPLSLMGVGIDSEDGRPPLTINGGPLKPVTYRLPVASAQVKSAVLLAGLYASGRTAVVETNPSRDHTERLLPTFGVDIERREIAEDGVTKIEITLNGPAKLRSTSLRVPGDISSAAYLVGLGLALADSEVRLRHVGLNPTRTTFLELLAETGADLQWRVTGEEAGEPVGDIIARSSALKAFSVSEAIVPGLIDEIPLLAVLAARADGETVISGAGELRVKETDRIAAMVECLKTVGADVRELPDGLVVKGPASLEGGKTVSSRGDHRIAMAMTVAGALCRRPIAIEDAGWVDISFPGFFAVIDALSR